MCVCLCECVCGHRHLLMLTPAYLEAENVERESLLVAGSGQRAVVEDLVGLAAQEGHGAGDVLDGLEVAAGSGAAAAGGIGACRGAEQLQHLLPLLHLRVALGRQQPAARDLFGVGLGSRHHFEGRGGRAGRGGGLAGQADLEQVVAAEEEGGAVELARVEVGLGQGVDVRQRAVGQRHCLVRPEERRLVLVLMGGGWWVSNQQQPTVVVAGGRVRRLTCSE